MTIGTYFLLAFCIGFMGTLVAMALGMCRVSGQFSRAEEIDEAKRKWRDHGTRTEASTNRFQVADE